MLASCLQLHQLAVREIRRVFSTAREEQRYISFQRLCVQALAIGVMAYPLCTSQCGSYPTCVSPRSLLTTIKLRASSSTLSYCFINRRCLGDRREGCIILVSHPHHMGVTWVSQSHHMGVTRPSHDGCHMGVTIPSHGYHMGVTSPSHGCHMGVTRPSHDGCHMGVTIPSHGYHKPITWVSHGCHKPITWVSHGCHKPIIWVSYGCHNPIT